MRNKNIIYCTSKSFATMLLIKRYFEWNIFNNIPIYINLILRLLLYLPIYLL